MSSRHTRSVLRVTFLLTLSAALGLGISSLSTTSSVPEPSTADAAEPRGDRGTHGPCYIARLDWEDVEVVAVWDEATESWLEPDSLLVEPAPVEVDTVLVVCL